MKICQPTVIKYLKMTKTPVLSDNSIVDRYVPLIKKFIIKGCKTDLYCNIKDP